MAEKTVVKNNFYFCLPDALDMSKAAALANPAMSSWAALTQRAKIQRGESVLINGATGTSGRLAVQIAKYLGAKHVVATGRDPQTLERLPKLGADAVISLVQPPDDLTKAVRLSLHEKNITIVLDYLWGASALSIINAIGGPGAPHSDRSTRFVQIGSVSGGEIAFPASALRSTALEVMGSGLGSVGDAALLQCINDAFQADEAKNFEIDFDVVAMSDGEKAWSADKGKERLVLKLS